MLYQDLFGYSLNGIFPLAKFPLSDYFPQQIKNEAAEFAVLRSYIKENAEVISFLISTKSVDNRGKFRLYMLDLEISNFNFMKDSISVIDRRNPIKK